jgi:hypothetical protein
MASRKQRVGVADLEAFVASSVADVTSSPPAVPAPLRQPAKPGNVVGAGGRERARGKFARGEDIPDTSARIVASNSSSPSKDGACNVAVPRKSGALPVFGSYDLDDCGLDDEARCPAPLPVVPVSKSNVTAYRKPSEPEDVSYRVYTPVVAAPSVPVKKAGYALRHSKIVPPKGDKVVVVATEATSASAGGFTPDDDDDSEDDLPPGYGGYDDDDDGRELEDEVDIWSSGHPAPKPQPQPVVAKAEAKPPRHSAPVASVSAKPKPAAHHTPAKLREFAYQKVGMDGANPNIPASLVTKSKDCSDSTPIPPVEHKEEDKLYYSKKARPVDYKSARC